MRRERDALTRELTADRQARSKLEGRLQAKEAQMETMGRSLTFLEEKAEAYETLIEESEAAYGKVGESEQITENAGRLVTMLHEQCEKLEARSMAGSRPVN
jgi:septal ring factor EnvC (AmiA/AmiB activator)